MAARAAPNLPGTFMNPTFLRTVTFATWAASLVACTSGSGSPAVSFDAASTQMDGGSGSQLTEGGPSDGETASDGSSPTAESDSGSQMAEAGSSPDGETTSDGASLAEAQAPEGGPLSDGETASDGAGTGGSCPATVGSTCTSIANVGSPVAITCPAGTPPAMTGGAIAEGTYVLAGLAYYGTNTGEGGACGITGPAETFLISGGCWQAVSSGDTATPNSSATY